MKKNKNCQWRIARRPSGNVVNDDFEYREVDIPKIKDGQVLLKTLYLNLAPVMRMYMSGKSIAGESALNIGDLIHGRGVAEVVESRHNDYKVGDILQGQMGWQTYKVSSITSSEKFRKVPDTGISYSIGLSLFGMTGFSAYFGFFNSGAPRQEDTVVISGAAGGVGSIVVQLAKNLGCQVIGIAGGHEKSRFIKDLGCDIALDYKSGDIAEKIKDATPDGIDLYFDNVGGEILSACLNNLAQNSRVVLCGSISEYLSSEPYGLKNYTNLRKTNSTMQGFFIYNHMDDLDEAEKEMKDWISSEKIKPVEYIFNGFLSMPDSLASLYEGENYGVALCRVAPGPYDH
ncbi:MAG: NADP-dependent oxidoreductase [Gammaproteobacteria bacterium]|nr:NADP-dependent oxidoreductase [Gammaproteobacteria bacterium]